MSHIFPFIRFGTGMEKIFLEIGGLDGIQATNTLFLERCRRWRGVLVEGNRDQFRRLLRNRPALVAIGSAICPTHTTVVFGGHAGAGAKVMHWPPLPVEEEKEALATHAPCGPLGDYLKVLGINRIGLFSLDVEGFELQILQSIDWSQVSIAALVVEELTRDRTKNVHMREFLRDNASLDWVFTYCWMPKNCDGYYVNSAWVDVGQLRKHLDLAPLPVTPDMATNSFQVSFPHNYSRMRFGEGCLA